MQHDIIQKVLLSSHEIEMRYLQRFSWLKNLVFMLSPLINEMFKQSQDLD